MMTFQIVKSFIEYCLELTFAVQARELTQSQTILQNQIEKLGDHFFEKGTWSYLGKLL